MSQQLSLLHRRNSSPRLTGPAPSRSEMRDIIQAAIRVPDHAWLRPWRFLSMTGERRNAFGDILARSLTRRDPQADEAAKTKAKNAPLRAPLIIVVVACLQEHPKVPVHEQWLSAGCAAHAIMLAAEALGYAGVWRTGDAAFDRSLMTDLGLADNEEIVGFIYLGTREGPAKAVPTLNPEHFLSDW